MIHIKMIINGRAGQWHLVSDGFYERLKVYSTAKPWRDIIIITREYKGDKI